ncbi:MAG: DUF4397 domain-containing protein [Candidatus Eremiobacteraeota bacterium]|nr:DUF4397 domain-containing protein [Candidatus Eremiobacteraeota bacterium]
MMMQRSFLSGIAAALASALLAACNGNGFNLGTTTGGTGLNSTVRFLNGSPDVGTVDAYFGATNTSAAASALAYGAVSAYVSYPTQAFNVIITASGTTTQKLTCTTALLGIYRYTIVIAGRAANGTGTSTGLQCQVFAEVPQAIPSGQEALAVHHAAPAFAAGGNATLTFGTYTPGQSTYSAPAASATFNGTLTTNATVGSTVYAILPGVTSGNGEGVYVAKQTSTAPSTVYATILPSQAATGGAAGPGTNDVGNYLPSSTSSLFDVYAVDAATAGNVALIAALD